MLTPEERLTTVEYNLDQFKAEATSYYQEMAMQVTMTRGLTEDAVKRLMQLRIQVDKRFNNTDQELVGVKQDVAEVKQELAGVKQDVTEVKQELAGVKQDVAEVKQELAGVKQNISDHTTRLDRLETKVDAVQTTLAQILARLPEKP